MTDPFDPMSISAKPKDKDERKRRDILAGASLGGKISGPRAKSKWRLISIGNRDIARASGYRSRKHEDS